MQYGCYHSDKCRKIQMTYFFRISKLIKKSIFACAKCPPLGLFQLICSVVSVNGVNSVNSEKVMCFKSFWRKCLNSYPHLHIFKPQLKP